jgi:type IVB pilus formation R64 PilN family outer membrane protein
MIREMAIPTGLALLITACSNQGLADRTNAAAEKTTIVATEHESRPPIRPTHAVFLGRTHVDTEHGDPIADRFDGPQGFVWSPPPNERLTLTQIAARITKFTGFGVNIEDGSVVSTASLTTPSPTAPRIGPSGPQAQGDPAIETINDLIHDSSSAPGAKALPQSEHIEPYSGSLSGFLDTVATLFGRDWELHGHTVYFPKYLTRIYQIDDLNSDTTASAGLTGLSASSGSTGSGSTGSSASGTTGSGGGTSSGQNSNTTTIIKPWDEIIKTAQMLAGDKNVTPAPASHEISVRCPRLCQEQVKQYVRDHNREVSRTVHLVVAIRTLSTTSSDEYGFSPTLAYQNLGFTLAVQPQGSQLPTTNTPGSIVSSILNPPGGTSKFSGTSLSLQALSLIDKSTTGITKEALVSNNRPFALRNALDFSFVGQSSTTSTSALATATSSLTTLIIGDQLQILPHLTNDGHIRISLALSQTAQQGNLVTAQLGGGAEATFPQVTDNATAPMEFTMRDGQTIILTDVSSRTSDHGTSGSCGVYCWLLGGSDQASNSNSRTILIITAEETHTGDEDASALGTRAE